MDTAHLEQLRLPPRRAHPATSRLWREWCFARVAVRHIRWRFALLVALLVGGGLLFQWFEPERQHSLPRGIYYTWALIFGEPPEAFPESWVLRAMFFVVPVLGLLVILEGIVDFSLVLRDRRRNERPWCRVMAASLSDHVVLIGLGKLGYRSFRLLRRLGEAVVVIEQNPDNRFLEEVRREGIPLLVGDARRDALLEEANIANAKSIILATNNDLANLEAALDARRMNPNIRVVLRMFDQNMADKIREGFSICGAMSQSAISTPAFVMAAVEESIISSTVINDKLVVTQRWFVRCDGALCGKTVGDVMVDYGVGIVERRPRDGEPRLMPPPDTRLHEGDQLLVQGAFEVLSELRRERPQLSTSTTQNHILRCPDATSPGPGPN